MAYTYAELHKKTVDELREIAKGIEHDAVQGFSQMNKEHLLPALCTALEIDVHAHHEAVGIDRPAVKAQIRALKAERDQALAARDHQGLKRVRRKIHRLKRVIRAATA
jgi:hypothetical protein